MISTTEAYAAKLEMRRAEQSLVQAQSEFAELRAVMGYLLGTPPEAAEQLQSEKEADATSDYTAASPTRSSRALPGATNSLSTRLKFLRSQLDQPSEASFEDLSLQDVLAYLQDLHNIDIILDDRAFTQNDGKLPHITLAFAGVSLGALLQAIEDTGNVQFVVREYGILVVPKGAAPKDAVTLHEFWKGTRRPPPPAR